jgi:FkbM family methyltransferase
MDRVLAALLGRDGVFLEAGANDGVRYSNTYLLERFYGWQGVLVEAIPSLSRDCARNRPRATVVQAALTAPGAPETVRLSDRDLNSQVRADGTVEVAARTLSQILDDAGVEELDLLSLDVEGHEEKALLGLDLNRHAPRYLLIEIWGFEERHDRLENEILQGRYALDRKMTELDYLYRRIDAHERNSQLS